MFKSRIFVIVWILSGLLLMGQSITVTSPNGGESLEKGAHHAIQWTITGVSTGTLKITLWQGSKSMGTIATGLPCSQHSFDWSVGNLEGAPAAPASTGYTVKVKLQGQPLADESDGTFAITQKDVMEFNVKWFHRLQIRPGLKRGSYRFSAPFIVKNGHLDRAKVLFYVQLNGTGLPVRVDSREYRDIAPGVPVDVTFQWRTAVAGTHKASFIFDRDMQPRESSANRNDNLTANTFTVASPREVTPKSPAPESNLPDFHVYGIMASADNYLVIKYENLGSRYEGDLELKYKIKGVESTVSQHVVIGHGTRGLYLTGRPLTASDLADNGRSIGVWATINPEHKVGEESFTNNQLYFTVEPDLGIPDYTFTGMEYVLVKRHDYGRHLPKGHLKVKIKNIGSAFNGMVTLTQAFRYVDETGFPHVMTGLEKSVMLNLGENQEVWVTFRDFWWPVRATTTKEPVIFQVRIIPGAGNPEIITANNVISRLWKPDGPF